METIDDRAQEGLLRSHFRALRSLPRFAQTPIVTVIEANLSWVVVRAPAPLAAPVARVLLAQS